MRAPLARAHAVDTTALLRSTFEVAGTPTHCFHFSHLLQKHTLLPWQSAMYLLRKAETNRTHGSRMMTSVRGASRWKRALT